MGKNSGLNESSGSMGKRLSVAVGAAIEAKADDRLIRIYNLMGDCGQ